MAVELIETAQAMQQFIAAIEDDLQQQPLLAIDTEFFRETTYYPKLGLVQLATQNHLACIDPLAFDARDALAQLLLDSGITKLFHSCSQDIEVLQQYLGAPPCPLLDTQIAAAMLGEANQISYAGLVARLLGIELAKSQTRTHWLRRPLSHQQLDYAAEDVLYLIPVYQHLYENLKQQGRLSWLQDDCEQLCRDRQRFEPDFARCWQRVRGTQKLTPEQLGIVDALAQWREHRAIQLDKTRRQVLSDDFIVQAAVQQPDDSHTLRRCGPHTRELSERDFNDMLHAMRQARAADPQSWPQHSRLHLDSEHKRTVRELMRAIERKAEELGVAQATLGSRKDVEKLLHTQRDSTLLRGWRQRVIGEHLLSLLPQA